MYTTSLAQETSFAIGPVEVVPETRSVRREGRRDQIVEPRVMQVLVALARAGGHVVSRDDLVESCWNGRIVGDDAVNRVISRLRRLAEELGDDVFAVETITKVGYRLRLIDGVAASAQVRADPSIDRRLLIAGAAGMAMLAGTAQWLGRGRSPPLAPRLDTQTAALMTQAIFALRQSTREGQSQAVGLLRRLVAIAPDYADGWGQLGIAYSLIVHYRPTEEAHDLRRRATDAGNRALAIDPGNIKGQVAITMARPIARNWLANETALLRAGRKHPQDEDFIRCLAATYSSVGRVGDAFVLCRQMRALGNVTPGLMFTLIQAYWASGRVEETDALIAEATRLYPTHFAIWFGQYYVLMFGGRPDAALALTTDSGRRPSGIPDDEIAAVARVAVALRAPEPARTDAVIAEQVERAHHGAGAAENAAQFAAALGRIDTSFAILDAYYFAQGFDPGEVRFSRAQGTYTPRNDRLTAFLFNPALAPLRVDSRFAALTERLGLADYWRRSGRRPDYLSTA